MMELPMATLLPHLRPAIGLQAGHQLMNLDRHTASDLTLGTDASSNALSLPQARHAGRDRLTTLVERQE